MVILIFLNIILIIVLIFLILYIFRNKKYDIKNISINENDEKYIKNENIKYKKNKKINPPDRVFFGRFITDDEYKHMMKYRRSNLSILLEDIDNEYEHLKELNK